MEISSEEILETIKMVQMQNLDIRAVTMSINLLDCSHPNLKILKSKIRKKITDHGKNLVEIAREHLLADVHNVTAKICDCGGHFR